MSRAKKVVASLLPITASPIFAHAPSSALTPSENTQSSSYSHSTVTPKLDSYSKFVEATHQAGYTDQDIKISKGLL